MNKIKKWFKKNQKGAIFGGLAGGAMAIMALTNTNGFFGNIVFGIISPACSVMPYFCSINFLSVVLMVAIGAIAGSIIDNYR